MTTPATTQTTTPTTSPSSSRTLSDPDDFSHLAGGALVTGGTGGIGAAICRMLAQRGSRVAVGYRRGRDAAEQLVGEFPQGQCLAVHVDLADPASIAAAVDVAASEFGGIHTFVHAAGPHVPQMHLSKVDPTLLAQQLNEDVVGFFTVAQQCLAHLRESRGSIVAVTTAATLRYPVRDGLSSGPKAAVDAFVRGLAAEEGRFGVRANSVGPGMLTDGMAQRLMASGDLDEAALAVTRKNIPLRTFGDANDIAEAVCFLASARADFISGQLLAVDGGYTV